jgi:hypothetical protein
MFQLNSRFVVSKLIGADSYYWQWAEKASMNRPGESVLSQH